MKKDKVETAILKKIEKAGRKEALACRGSMEPPWPECRVIFHQPKRPKRTEK